MHRPILAAISAVLTVAVSLVVPSFAQSSDLNLNLHSKSHAAAKDIGLPVYPGATPFKEKDSDSSSADLGISLNSFQLSVKVVTFVTPDSPEQVLVFYRKPLGKFGEVLECDHGKPVGSLTVTKSGLTCGDHHGGHSTVNGNDNSHELRAATPEQFRIVGVDGNRSGHTKFGLVALVLPKDKDR